MSAEVLAVEANTLGEVIRATGMPVELATPVLDLIGASGTGQPEVLGMLSQEERSRPCKSMASRST